MQRICFSVAALTWGIATAGFLRGWSKGEADLLQTSSGLAAASLALLGVTIGFSTWRRERAQAREAHQRESYVQLIRGAFSTFTQTGVNPESEARLRAEVVTWGSPSVVEALSSWNQTIDKLTDIRSGRIELTDDDQRVMRNAITDIVVAVRKELHRGSDVNRGQIEHALFND